MSLRVLRFISILLASLLMATAFGHTLEMPMKMRASPELMVDVPTQSLCLARNRWRTG